MLKMCTKCEQEKVIDAFGIRRDAKDGHASRCKECRRAAPRSKRVYALCAKPAKNGFPCGQQARHYGFCKNARCYVCGAPELKKSPSRTYPLCVACYRVGAAKRIKKYRGSHPNCKNRIIQHNISKEDYFWLVEKQQGVCALCGVPRLKKLHVDHSHDCLNHEGSRHFGCRFCIRGLLCHFCNPRLGHIEKWIVLGWIVPTEILKKYLIERPLYGRPKRKTRNPTVMGPSGESAPSLGTTEIRRESFAPESANQQC